MKTIITIKKGYVYFDGTDLEPIKLEDIIIHIYETAEMSRADYLLQKIFDHEGIPNKFSIARKFGKYKITNEQKKIVEKSLADKFKV